MERGGRRSGVSVIWYETLSCLQLLQGRKMKTRRGKVTNVPYFKAKAKLIYNKPENIDQNASRPNWRICTCHS